MYYTLFKDLKQIIADAFGITLDPDTGIAIGTTDSRLKDIQWFNNQYAGTIHTVPAVYIEFSDLDITQKTKQANATRIRIRLHIVTEVMDESDGDVWDTDVRAHELLASDVLKAVDGWCLSFDGSESRPLRPVSWSHQHKNNGWMVTQIGLETKG